MRKKCHPHGRRRGLGSGSQPAVSSPAPGLLGGGVVFLPHPTCRAAAASGWRPHPARVLGGCRVCGSRPVRGSRAEEDRNLVEKMSAGEGVRTLPGVCGGAGAGTEATAGRPAPPCRAASQGLLVSERRYRRPRQRRRKGEGPDGGTLRRDRSGQGGRRSGDWEGGFRPPAAFDDPKRRWRRRPRFQG